MYKKIEPNNKIFNSTQFQKDKYKFSLILRNLASPTLELYSDEENYIICRGSKEYPTWIWTIDGFPKEKINEIQELMTMYLTGSNSDKFTCKKELYDLLKLNKYKYLNDDYFEMGFLMCSQTIEPKHCEGCIDKIYESDRSVLEQYWYDDCNKMDGVDSISMEQAKKEVDNFYKDENFYIWRCNNKIVSMANYRVIDDQAKISHVYTPEDERRKGYASNLIYAMTNSILVKELIPIIYTDYHYKASNAAYISVGFEDKGILINFSCSKNK